MEKGWPRGYDKSHEFKEQLRVKKAIVRGLIDRLQSEAAVPGGRR